MINQNECGCQLKSHKRPRGPQYMCKYVQIYEKSRYTCTLETEMYVFVLDKVILRMFSIQSYD